MKPSRFDRPHNAAMRGVAPLFFWTCLCLTGAGYVPNLRAAPNITLWDTSTSVAGAPIAADRAAWKVVPPDLLALEVNPEKARSDPGYYGREYAFKGDAVVETHSLAALFSGPEGRVQIYPRKSASGPAGGGEGQGFDAKLFEICPLELKGKPAIISHVAVLRNTGDELELEAGFSTQSGPEVSDVFVFDRSGLIEIQPARNSSGVDISGPIERGIVPSFIGDDLIYNAADYPGVKTLSLPSENLFLGLLKGEQHELAMTWPKGRRQINLEAGDEESGERLIDSIHFSNDGQSLYLTLLSAPGIWHREPLKPDFLERDVTIQWKRPFPAKWKTQLDEGGTRTTYNFRDNKQEIWRGVSGSYIYPVWFEGDSASYHFSKKVPPRGESLIYFVESQDTPASICTPADFLNATLGRATAEPIIDLSGRKLSTHHRRGADGVRRACTCGCTEAIQAVFEAGQETSRKDYISGAVDDMIYFIHRHVERIDHYRAFVNDLTGFLQANAASSPDLKPYVESLAQIARQIPDEYNVQKENMKDFQHADDLARQTLVLAGKTDPNNLKAYMALLDAWREMGGAQDYVLARCHEITRKLCQEAGYGCATLPKAADLAGQVRSRCRECLRNPDGYEIWADY